MANENKVIITLVKSPIGAKKNQKDTLKALGLTKMNKSVEKVNNEFIQGMIKLLDTLLKLKKVNSRRCKHEATRITIYRRCT